MQVPVTWFRRRGLHKGWTRTTDHTLGCVRPLAYEFLACLVRAITSTQACICIFMPMAGNERLAREFQLSAVWRTCLPLKIVSPIYKIVPSQNQRVPHSPIYAPICPSVRLGCTPTAQTHEQRHSAPATRADNAGICRPCSCGPRCVMCFSSPL